MNNPRNDVLLYIMSGIATVVAAFFGIFVVHLQLISLPALIQTGVFLAIAALFTAVALLLRLLFNKEDKFHKRKKGEERGYLYAYRERHGGYGIFISIVFVIIAFLIGIATEGIYTFFGERQVVNQTTFAGSYIVADFSGSMDTNDPDEEMKKAIADYIRNISMNRRFGITLFNTDIEIFPAKPDDMNAEEYELALKMFKEYTYFESNDQKENVIQLVESIEYSGATSTNGSLLAVLDRMRRTVEADDSNVYFNNMDNQMYPGVVLLFSDGIPTDSNSFNEIRSLARNNGSKMIPINTIFYRNIDGSNPGGENFLRRISNDSGGNFMLTPPGGFSDIFSVSFESFALENPRLMFTTYGPLANSIPRILFQGFLLILWPVMSALAVYLIIGNRKLLKSFFIWKIVWSVLLTIVAVCFLQGSDVVLQSIAQFLIVIAFVFCCPVYSFRLSKSRNQ